MNHADPRLSPTTSATLGGKEPPTPIHRMTGGWAVPLTGATGLVLWLGYLENHGVPDLSSVATIAWAPVLRCGLQSTLAMLVFWGLLSGLGEGLFRLVGQGARDHPVRFALGLIWVLSGSTLLLLAGLFQSPWIWLLGMPLIGWVRRPAAAGSPSRPAPSPPPRAGLGFLLLLGLLWNAFAFVPLAAYDDLLYQADLVRSFREEGTLWVHSRQPNSHRPALHSALMAAVGTIAGDPWPVAVNGWLLLLTALVLMTAPGTAGWLAAAVWLANPLLVRLLGTCYAEPLLCLLWVLALSPSVGRRPFLQGICLGLLPGTKFSGLVLSLVGLGGSVVAATAQRSEEPPTTGLDAVAAGPLPPFESRPEGQRDAPPAALSGPTSAPISGQTSGLTSASTSAPRSPPCLLLLVAGFVVGVLAGPLPYLWRSARITGNPLYPHLGSLFPNPRGVAMHELMNLLPPPTREIPWHEDLFLSRFGPGRDPLSLLTAPWNLLMNSHFHDGTHSLAYFDGQLGYLPLVVGVLAVLLWGTGRLPPAARPPLAITLGAWVFWLWGPHMARLALPFIVATAWLGGLLLPSAPGTGRRLLGMVCLLALLWTGQETVRRLDAASPVLAGVETPTDFLRARLPAYDGFTWLNTQTASDARVLVLLEERTYPLRREYVWTGLLPIWFANFLLRANSVDTALAAIDRQGITHIFLPRFGRQVLIDLLPDPDYHALLKAFWAHWTIVYEDRFTLIFQRRPP